MIKLLLVLTVFTSSNGWERLTDNPPQEFTSIAECLAAAAKFLEHTERALNKEVPAVGAQCVMGNEEF